MTTNNIEATRVDLESSALTRLPIAFNGTERELKARAYQVANDPHSQALVLIHGDGPGVPIVRIQSGCVTGDIFHSLRCDCYEQLQSSLADIVAADHGIMLYLPYHEGRGIGLLNKIRAYALQEEGLDTVDANISLGEPVDARDYDLAAHILQDLNILAVRLLTNNPTKVQGLEARGIEVAERLPLVIAPNPHNETYLKTKKDRMSHSL